MADDAGALLVRSGLVSSSALDDARARATAAGGTIGEHLVVANAIGDDALTDFYRSRLLVPQVNPNTLARLPVRVVATIPSDMAIELRAIPVALDAENNLTVAMSDPSDRHAVDEIAFFTGAYVVRAVATQMQIAWCLAHYYGHVTALGQRLLQGTSDPTPAPTPRTKGLTGQVEAMRHKAIAPTSAAAAPEPVTEAASDGIPDNPRARSVSGEIRIPARRAPSIRPPMPEVDESGPTISIESGPVISIESGPVITIEVAPELDDKTQPQRIPPRRRAVKSDPPELAARAGEVNIAEDRERRVDDGPGIIIADELLEPPPPPEPRIDSAAPSHSIDVSDESTGVVIHERMDHDTDAVMLLDRPRSHASALEPDDVVVLDAKKPRVARIEKRTQVGIGALPAVTRPARDVDPEADGPTDIHTPGLGAASEDPSDPVVEPPRPVPRSQRPTVDEDDPSDDSLRASDHSGPATMVMSKSELDAAIPQRHSDGMLPIVEDEWGPPGSTIPPTLLGSIPGAAHEDMSGRIPVFVAPPSPPERARGAAPGSPPPSPARAHEDATTRLLQLIRDLEHAQDRDAVITMMVAHLADTHRRAGFFVVKPGPIKGTSELSVFAVEPRPPSMPFATLRLDRPSTLQDVVGTRLPYRGPTQDEPSRIFLAGTLGVAPPEILLLPVVVRERVVGVLFAETRIRHTFDDQTALAARAAGMALERILMAKRGA